MMLMMMWLDRLSWLSLLILLEPPHYRLYMLVDEIKFFSFYNLLLIIGLRRYPPATLDTCFLRIKYIVNSVTKKTYFTS